MSHVQFLRELRGVVGKYGLNHEAFIGDAKKIAQFKYGVTPNPLGIKNRKVGGASTYRKLGDTCPACRYADICYAYAFPAGIHGKRASPDVAPSLFGAAIGAAFAERYDTILRLHTTGGFAKPGQVVDTEYIEGLLELGHALGRHKPWAYSFTHFTVAEFYGHQQMLSRAGIEVLYSDVPVIGGAIIWDHNDMDTLRTLFPHVTWARCRYQVDKTPCVSCRLCLDARALEIGIVFQVHAGHQDEIAESSKTLLLDLASATERVCVSEVLPLHVPEVQLTGR